MPRVWNKHTEAPPADAVYVGRPTAFGNPFSHMTGTLAAHRVRTRHEAIVAFERWFVAQPALIERAKLELRGKDLVCWCAPLPCHAAVLLRIANSVEADKAV